MRRDRTGEELTDDTDAYPVDRTAIVPHPCDDVRCLICHAPIPDNSDLTLFSLSTDNYAS